MRFQFGDTGALFRKLLLRGTPEAIAQFAVPVATLCTNYVLLARLGDMAVNAYSIICYVASFSAAIFIGVSSGLQPLFGQSYGAKDAQELRWFFRAGVLIDLIGSALINVVLLFVGGPICKMFGADALTLACTVQYMPRYAWGFIIMSVNTLISAYLYSTKRTKQAVILNLCRSFLLDSAVIFAVPAIFGGSAVARLLELGKAPEQLTQDDLSYIGSYALTAASLSTEHSGGIPSIPSKEAVLAAMEEGLTEPVTFAKYPRDPAYVTTVRERVNALIAAAL